ncbi:Helicase C-terminal [Penicillium capsulatum]|uniref:Helicase C-terminal n=1 Tax=Penicillium capsulatum TaxID=69766 RepID=A0A9W9I0R0_9EURO|nr:Helicase C-terminal [Penicillium capsulatum]KAJ6117769.1 Helicase C-terminal [Penicillium capsulatum]
MAPPHGSGPSGGGKGGRRNPLEGYSNINFTAETIKDLDGSASRLAGAMGLEGSYQLHRLFSSTCPDTYGVIREYVEDRLKDFDHSQLPKNLRTIHPHTVIDAVERVGQFTVALLAEKPPTLETQNVTQENLFSVRQMWWSRRYLLTRPNDFGARSQLRHQPLSFDAKETFLAWKVLSHFYINIRKNPRFSAKSTQHNKAIPPQLIQPSTRRRVAAVTSTTTDTRIAAIENVLAAYDRSAANEVDLDSPDALDSSTVDVVGDASYSKLVLELGASLDRPASARLGRPPLALADIKALHASLCDRSFHTGNVLIYKPPNPSVLTPSSGHTIATIATSEAIVGTTTAEDDAGDEVGPSPVHQQNATVDADIALDVVRQRQQLQVSAVPPSFDAAVARLGLNIGDDSHAIFHPPNTFQVPPTLLKPWQVTAVAWMLEQEASPLHGGLLADACGLGKTLTALTLIWADNQRRESQETSRTFTPSLILVPNALMDTWITEIDRHFGDALTLIIFFGSSNRTGDQHRKSQTISRIEDLQAALARLDPSDPATGTTVVLSSYQTWARRTTREVDREGKPVTRARRPTWASRPAADPRTLDREGEEEAFDEDLLTDDEDNDDDHDDDDDDDNGNDPGEGVKDPTPTSLGASPESDTADAIRDELAGLQDASSTDQATTKHATRRRFFMGLLRVTFQRVVCDEGHRVKTISSRQHQSVAKLTRSATWFLTATPMWNKPLDFCGYLSLLWTEMVAAQPEATGDSDVSTDLKDYQMWSARADLPPADRPYHLLSPAGLISLSRKGHLTSRVGFDALPILLRLTCLCREPGHLMTGANGQTVVIGGDIPNLAITTVELRYTRTTQVAHDHIYHQIIEGLYGGLAAGEAPRDDMVAIDWATYRQLCHLAVNPKLDLFLRRSASHVLSADISAFGDCGDDHGFGLFFARTIEDRATDLPTNRMAVARYLAHDCPRLRFLLHLLWTEGTLAESGRRPRFLVYCNWPFTRWMVEMFLAALGVDFQVIRAGMSLEARSTAISQFTNPDSTTTVLVTTFNCGALGLNMHGNCSRIVLLEGSQNYNSVFQTVGRIHRLGQSEAQKAWIVFQDHTIQRFSEHNCTKKILPQIAAQFRPWLQTQVATLATTGSTDTPTDPSNDVDPDTEVDADLTDLDADTEMTDVDPTSPDTKVESPPDAVADAIQEDEALEEHAYQVLGDMLGLAKAAPNRLGMKDHRDLGLSGVTRKGKSYSTRGLASSAPKPVTPVKPHRSRKRAMSPSSLTPDSKTPRREM